MKRKTSYFLLLGVGIVVFSLVFLPMCYTPTPYLLGFPLTRKERALDVTLKIQKARHDIKLLYEWNEDLQDFEDVCRSGRDPWGHTYNVCFMTNELSGEWGAEKVEPVLYKSCSGTITSFTNTSCRIAGKAVAIDRVTVLVWSSGPNGIDEKTEGDDVVLR